MDYDNAAADSGHDFAETQGPIAPDSSGNENDWEATNLKEAPSSTSWTPGNWYYDTTLRTSKSDIVDNATRIGDAGSGDGGTIASGNYIYLVPSGNEVAGANVTSGNFSLNQNMKYFRRNFNDDAWVHSSGAGGYGQADQQIWGPDDTDTYRLNPECDFYLLSDYSGSVATNYGDVPALNTKLDATDVDVSPDTPTPFDDEINGAGNYCTWNSLFAQPSYSNALSQGNLKVVGTGDRHGTMRFGSGKWYWELTFNSGTLGQAYHGIIDIGNNPDRSWITSNIAATRDTNYGLYGDSSTGSNPAAWAAGDVINFAVDVDNQKFFIGVNGTWTNSADPAAGTGASFTGRDFSNYTPLFSDANTDATYTANFGARAYKYTPPSGFKSLNTYNMPDPVIEDPSKHFDVSIWTADDEDSKDIDGLNFQPDMVWGKNRDTAVNNQLFDALRGTGASKELTPNESKEEGNTTDPDTEAYGFLSAFNSDGFTVAKGDDGSGYQNYYWNYQTNKHVAWSWNVGTATSNTSVSVGDLNDTLYDQSDDWSGDGTSDGNTNTGQGWDKAFDNERGNYYKGAYTLGSSSSTFTFDPNNKPTWSNKIEVYFRKYDGTANVNGGSDFTTVSEWTTAGVYVEGWYDISSIAGTSGTLSTITTTDVSNNYVAIQSIRLDGKILVDSTVSVADAPSIASDYRVNNDAGFSIVTYTGNAVSGATIAHGLNAKPDFGIFKARETDGYTWYVYHKELGNTHHLYLDGTYAYNDDSGAWNDTDPDSNVMTVGNANPNPSGEDMVAYLWSEVAGYSKFGYYYGNDLDDGAYVSCGFKPAFILIKNANTASTEWVIVDNERDPDNVVKEVLNSNDTTADDNSATIVDFLSNGFKLRSASNRVNESKGSGDPPNFMVYAAFAESPFKYANAR